jgi:hypothetical protein
MLGTLPPLGNKKKIQNYKEKKHKIQNKQEIKKITRKITETIKTIGLNKIFDI